MESFSQLLALLASIPDPRRAEGKLYKLQFVLLFSILAVVTGANSYRGVRTFINTNRIRLNNAFGLSWKRAPAHTAIRYILQGLKPTDVEQAFRLHAASLNGYSTTPTDTMSENSKSNRRAIALDGKTLKGSFDNFNDKKAAQVFSAFATDTALIIAHIEIDEKSNEIPAAQQLLAELNVANHTITLDAMHCQKKHLKPLLEPMPI